MTARQEWQAILNAQVTCDEVGPRRPQSGCYETEEGANLYVAWLRELAPSTTFPVEAARRPCGHWGIRSTGRGFWIA